MNDADFEQLARDSLGSALKNGWKPQTLPEETWLRMRALELAICRARPDDSAVEVAQKFYVFLKGADAPKMDQR